MSKRLFFCVILIFTNFDIQTSDKQLPKEQARAIQIFLAQSAMKLNGKAKGNEELEVYIRGDQYKGEYDELRTLQTMRFSKNLISNHLFTSLRSEEEVYVKDDLFRYKLENGYYPYTFVKVIKKTESNGY